MFKLFIYQAYVHVYKIEYFQITEYGALINDN